MSEELDRNRGVFGITVAAEMAGTGAQNLRTYERAGLLHPARTEGGTRRYSYNEITRLRRITELMSEGLNLAGVARVMELEDRIAELTAEVERFRNE